MLEAERLKIQVNTVNTYETTRYGTASKAAMSSSPDFPRRGEQASRRSAGLVAEAARASEGLMSEDLFRNVIMGVVFLTGLKMIMG